MLVTAALVTGLALIVGARSRSSRAGLSLVCSGVILVTFGGVAIAAGICQVGRNSALAGALVLSLGLLAVGAGQPGR